MFSIFFSFLCLHLTASNSSHVGLPLSFFNRNVRIRYITLTSHHLCLSLLIAVLHLYKQHCNYLYIITFIMCKIICNNVFWKVFAKHCLSCHCYHSNPNNMIERFLHLLMLFWKINTLLMNLQCLFSYSAISVPNTLLQFY